MKSENLSKKYQNKIFNEDVLKILAELPDNSVNMVYGDPDYNVGIQYAGRSYTKKWNEYIDWYGKLAEESYRVLREDGNMFLINYPKQNAHLRVKHLDSLAHSVHEYVWIYNTNVGHSPKRFTTAHRSILHATKTGNNSFYKNQVAQPYKNLEDKRIKARIAAGHKGRMPYSWMYFDLVKNVSAQKTGHPCQIPLDLFRLLLNASTIEGDTVFVLFGGSGNEVVEARNMGRCFMSCDLEEGYYSQILRSLDM